MMMMMMMMLYYIVIKWVGKCEVGKQLHLYY